MPNEISGKETMMHVLEYYFDDRDYRDSMSVPETVAISATTT